MSYPQLPAPADTCFICNQSVNFACSWDFAVSWSGLLPRGAKRPSALMWVHEDCARQAAHPEHEIQAARTTDEVE